MRMDALAAPAIAAVQDGRVRIHPESQRRRYLEWLENIRPWCISRQLWWGHQIPVWYRGRGDLRRPRAAARATAGSATPTCSTRGSPPACGRSPRSAGPTTRRSCAPSTRPTCSPRAATSSSSGSRGWSCSGSSSPATCRSPTSTSTRRSSPATAAGCPSRWARASTRSTLIDAARRRRHALRPAGDVLHPGRALLRREGRAGPAARQQALQRLAARAAARARGRRRCRRRARAADGRGRAGSSPACSGRRPSTARAIEEFEFHRAALGLYDFVYGELCDWYLEIVKPRLYEEDNAEVARVRAARAGRDARARPPGDPVRDRGALVAHPRRRRPADGPPLAARRRRRADRPGRRGGARPRDRRGAGAARLARPRRRRARRPCCPRGWRPRATSAPPSTSRGSPALDSSARRRRAGRDRRRAGRRRRRAASDAVDLEAAARRIDERRGVAARPRSRGRSASWPTRASWPRRPRRWSQAERDKLAALRRGAATACDLDARRRPRSTCSASSCSACASGWSACAGCSPRSARRRSASAPSTSSGTNGKSSTVRMTAALLEAHGVRAGRLPLAAPHARSPSASGSATSDLEPDAFGAAVERAAAAAAKVDRGAGGGRPRHPVRAASPPPRSTSSRAAGVEVAVVEAGLGGRHDATGVLRAPVVVLTNVGLEHTRWLGPTIARHRAREARGGGAGRDARARRAPTPEVERAGRGHAARGSCGRDAGRRRPLPGFQRTNFAVACAAARELLGALDEDAVARVAARITRARAAAGRRRAAADDPRRRAQPERRRGARRRAARARVRRASSRSSTTRTRARCCARCCRAAARFVCTAAPNPRALPPATLASLAEQLGGGGGDRRRARAPRSRARGSSPARRAR